MLLLWIRSDERFDTWVEERLNQTREIRSDERFRSDEKDQIRCERLDPMREIRSDQTVDLWVEEKLNQMREVG